MGQRHQVYLILPAKYYNKNNPNNRPERTLGLHHQWSYGQTALKLLNNFLEFYANTDEYTFQSDYSAQAAFEACFSFIPSEGYFHSVHNITDETEVIEDPRQGDNNDGITIIDLTQKTPKYCFMSVYGLEGEKQPKVKTPLSAEKYLSCYYPKFNKPTDDLNEYKFNLKSSVLIDSIDQNAELLTLDRVKEIFPAMFKRARKRA